LAWGCGLDSTGSEQGPVLGCCECGDEPSGSCATELVSYPIRQSSSITFLPAHRDLCIRLAVPSILKLCSRQ
jgi:hypothetical protein